MHLHQKKSNDLPTIGCNGTQYGSKNSYTGFLHSEDQHLSYHIPAHFQVHLTRELRDVVPGNPDPSTCSKSKSVATAESFEGGRRTITFRLIFVLNVMEVAYFFKHRKASVENDANSVTDSFIKRHKKYPNVLLLWSKTARNGYQFFLHILFIVQRFSI